MKARKHPKLSHRVQALASKYIAEEFESEKHKRGKRRKPKQLKAIGINRAKKYAKTHPLKRK